MYFLAIRAIHAIPQSPYLQGVTSILKIFGTALIQRHCWEKYGCPYTTILVVNTYMVCSFLMRTSVHIWLR